MAINALRQTPAIVRLIILRDESQYKDEGDHQRYKSEKRFFLHLKFVLKFLNASYVT